MVNYEYMRIYLREIKERYPEFEILNYEEDLYFENFNHDSRVKVEKSLFIPIEGENFDGHNFVKDAFENGSVLSLFQREKLEKTGKLIHPLIIVDDIQKALEKIVILTREKISVPVVAVTGSTGKTTTREMISSILSTGGKVLRSERNYNTLWGNAQILARFDDHDYIVLEIGMDRKGEIASQSTALRPDSGILLNVGYVHALSLGSIENIYLEKKELYEYLIDNDKPVFVNIDDEFFSKLGDKGRNVITFGFKRNAQFRVLKVDVYEKGTQFQFNYNNKSYDVTLNILGKEYVYNAISAIALCHELGFSIEEGIEGLKNFNGFHGRFEILKINKETIFINDAYNANPTSMKMALETFDSLWCNTDKNRILVLGDMRELGSVSGEKHKEIGRIVKNMDVQKVFYIGEYFKDFGTGELCRDLGDVYKYVKKEIEEIPNSVVLFKASNSLGLESIIQKFTPPI